MGLVLARAGLLAELDAELAARTAGAWRFGLYLDPAVVTPDTVVADLTVCTVGGYIGVMPMGVWGLAQWSPPRAVALHGPVVWTADGSTAAQSVRGYYVIDGTGVLRYVVPRPDGVALWGAAGQTYTLYPRYTRRAE